MAFERLMELRLFMVDLRPTNLHWLVDEDPSQDLCAHGGVYLKINDCLISDGTDIHWTLSTASFRLLKTVWSDYTPKGDLDEQLIPCCGHSMWVWDDSEDGLTIVGCPNGIDWEIKHASGNLTHILDDGSTEAVPLVEWRDAVCSFSKEVLEFFMTAWPKKADDQLEEEGFELFMRLWRSRLEKACNS